MIAEWMMKVDDELVAWEESTEGGYKYGDEP